MVGIEQYTSVLSVVMVVSKTALSQVNSSSLDIAEESEMLPVKPSVLSFNRNSGEWSPGVLNKVEYQENLSF